MSARRSPIGSTLAERVTHLSAVDPDSGCWMWIGATDRNGYGCLTMSYGSRSSKTKAKAHRVVYELKWGAIPDGMTVDHLCFNRGCVNPEHLQLLTPMENAARQRTALAGVCRRGHPFTPENTFWQPDRRKPVGERPMYRTCRTCRRASERRRRAVA